MQGFVMQDFDGCELVFGVLFAGLVTVRQLFVLQSMALCVTVQLLDQFEG